MTEDSCSMHFCSLKRCETAFQKDNARHKVSIRISESKRKRSRKATIPFKGLDLIDRVPDDYGMKFVTLYRR